MTPLVSAKRRRLRILPATARNRTLTAGSLFAGIGGFCDGFTSAGFKTLWANELDVGARDFYRTNFPRVRLIEKDICNLSVVKDKLIPVDVLHAGFPCQSFSQAGERKGFNDPRGQLFFEIIRLLKEFGDHRPSVLVLENAPFIRIGEGGGWFQTILGELQRAGYWFRDTNAHEVDLWDVTPSPQQRRRLFMIAWSTASFRSGRFTLPQPQSATRDCLSKHIAFKSRAGDAYYLPHDNRYHDMLSVVRGDRPSDKRIYQLRKYFVREKRLGVCPTLTANMGQGGHNVPFIWDKGGLRRLTERECLSLQGFARTYRIPKHITSKRIYHYIGNSVAPPVAKFLAAAIEKRIRKEQI